ncbi:MAG: branched-chain amino acid ABC transporter permease, partial [Alphaproteobacteria bacterium]|nr:branched-chain amino acid ABC transporter permease [Alphaproteobacteria bacterium]
MTMRVGAGPALAVTTIAIGVYAVGFASSYDLRVLTVSGIYVILVLGYQFIFGHAGALSLAQGAFFGLGAYVTGILGSQLGWQFTATFPLSILVPALLAATLALPVLRLESHYFALATLALGQGLLVIAINWEGVTGGANGLPGVPGIVIVDTVIPRGLALLTFVW